MASKESFMKFVEAFLKILNGNDQIDMDRIDDAGAVWTLDRLFLLRGRMCLCLEHSQF